MGQSLGKEPAFDVAFSADGRTVVSASYGVNVPAIRWWDLASGRERTCFVWPASEQNQMARYASGRRTHPPCFAAAPDGRTVAVGGAGFGRPDFLYCLQETAPGKQRILFERKTQAVVGLAFSSDGRSLASVDETHCLCLWEVATGEQRTLLREPTTDVRPLDFSPDTLAFSPDGTLLAVGGNDAVIRLYDPIGATEIGQFTGHQGAIRKLSFSADGRWLASAGGTDTTALVWDLAIVPRPKRQPAHLSHEQLQQLWTDLERRDAVGGYRAIRTLAAAPAQSVPFLRERLHFGPGIAVERIPGWIADLDSDRFAVRTRANAELERSGELARPFLEKALANRPSLEARRRAEQLLARLEKTEPSPKQLRRLRGLEALEHSATVEARRVLEALSKGPPEDSLVSEAKLAVQRLSRHQPGTR
jgi:hypothetical protein